MLFGLVMQSHHPYSAVPPESGAAPAADASPLSDGRRTTTPPPTAGVLDELAGALAARAIISNFLDLMCCEARRAGLALMWMIAWGIFAAIWIVPAWLGLMTALAMWAVSLGVLPIVAVIGVALLNCIAGAVAFCASIGMGHDLLFSATRRQLARTSPTMPPAP